MMPEVNTSGVKWRGDGRAFKMSCVDESILGQCFSLRKN